jgi:hypothetical protein
MIGGLLRRGRAQAMFPWGQLVHARNHGTQFSRCASARTAHLSLCSLHPQDQLVGTRHLRKGVGLPQTRSIPTRPTSLRTLSSCGMSVLTDPCDSIWIILERIRVNLLPPLSVCPYGRFLGRLTRFPQPAP